MGRIKYYVAIKKIELNLYDIGKFMLNEKVTKQFFKCDSFDN